MSKPARTSPARRHLALLQRRVGVILHDLPQLTAMGERMAEALLAGGGLAAPQVGSYWRAEFTGRAGGLMGLGRSDLQGASKKDVAFFALPDVRHWDPAQDPNFQRVLQSSAQLFAIGCQDDLQTAGALKRVAAFTGGVPCAGGSYAYRQFQPLAPLWQFEQLVRGWVTTGEMIAACTRGGKMPVMWMSIWLEGASVRNAHFMQCNSIREPWRPPLFHEDRYVPPLAPGKVGREFLLELARLLVLLDSQAAALARAGEWMAHAHTAGKKIHAIATGHSYPAILDLPKDAAYPIEWSGPNSNLATAIPAKFGRGDVSIHLGYSPVEVGDVKAILSRGLRFVYTSPYGRPVALKNHPNLLWLDLPWRPGDGTVDVPGYSVRILPMSSSVHTAAYLAMLCEMAERLDWK